MRRRDEPGDEVEQGGFTAARRSEQCHELAAADGEVDRGERPRAVRVDLVGPGDGDDGCALRGTCAQGRTFTSLTIDSVQADA